MENFPSNNKGPTRSRVEPETKKVERVVTGEVVRRKTPLGRRLSQNILGGDAQSVWGFMFGDVLIPAARDMIADALTGGIERAIFGESHHRGRARSSRGHIAYNQYSMSSNRGSRREEPRREISHRGRANHQFDEILIDSRAEASEILDRLEQMIIKFDAATVSDLYEMAGISSNYTDNKFGWTDLRDARVERVRGKYLLNLPRPEALD